MTIQVSTLRQDNIDPEEIKKAFLDLGWTYGGQGGLANITYLFTWQGNADTVYPNEPPCEITKLK